MLEQVTDWLNDIPDTWLLGVICVMLAALVIPIHIVAWFLGIMFFVVFIYKTS